MLDDVAKESGFTDWTDLEKNAFPISPYDVKTMIIRAAIWAAEYAEPINLDAHRLKEARKETRGMMGMSNVPTDAEVTRAYNER